MAGDNSRVHGFNPIYRNTGLVPRFASFPLNGQGPNPGPFTNRPVAQAPVPVPPLGVRLDHQGHIVSQNSMNLVLNDMMMEMSDVCNSPADVNVYINHAPHNAIWLNTAVAYGMKFGIPMFAFGTRLAHPNTLANAEDRVGDLFSIVTWNPVNICRAPDDIHRNGVPGNNLDAGVLACLNANPHGVDANWLAAANALAAAGAAPTAVQVRAYLAASAATLPGQHNVATGYYSFNWRAGPGVVGLIPG